MASDRSDLDGMGDAKYGYCSRHDVPLPCRFCALERYVLQQQQQQQETRRQEEERLQQRPRPGPRHEKLSQLQAQHATTSAAAAMLAASLPPATLLAGRAMQQPPPPPPPPMAPPPMPAMPAPSAMTQLALGAPFLPTFDPQLLQQQIQQQLELQIQQQLQQQLLQLQPRPPASLQQPGMPSKVLMVIQDQDKPAAAPSQAMYPSTSTAGAFKDLAGQRGKNKGRGNLPAWQQALDRPPAPPGGPSTAVGSGRGGGAQGGRGHGRGLQRTQQEGSAFSTLGLGEDTMQKLMFLPQQLLAQQQQQQQQLQQQQQQQQQQQHQQQQSAVQQEAASAAAPAGAPAKPPAKYPLDARQIQELQELRNKVQEMKMAQLLKAQGQEVPDPSPGPAPAPPRLQPPAARPGDIMVLAESCNYCHQPDHTNSQCPIALQSAINSVKTSEQKVRLMIEVAESIIHHRSVGVHALVMHEWRARQGIEQRALATHLERYLVLTFGMESIVRAQLVAQAAQEFGSLMEQYMSSRCPSWDQWLAELRDIQRMAKAGRPSAHQGRQLQVLEAFIQSIFHETLLVPGGTSRWPSDSLDRAVARALHLAICKLGDHAGYGVACAYCAALLRCIPSEQVHRESIGRLAWSPATHPRFPMPFRATCRAVVLSMSRACCGALSDGLAAAVLQFLPPLEVPGVVEPLDGAYNSLGCVPRYCPGTRRCFGTYQCPCGAAWRSAHTWAGRPQGCIACGQQVEPTHCDPLWLRAAVVDIPASYPNCVVVASSPIALSVSFPFVEQEADLDVFFRFRPSPLLRTLHSDLELEAQLVYASGPDALEARRAYECDYYLCGSDTSFLLPCLDSPCALRLARVPEGVAAETIQRDFQHLARLGAEECVPEVAFVPFGTPGYRTAVITFPEASVAAEVFFQYHCQLDETTELADCGVCQELGFSCTLQLQLHGGASPQQLTLRGIPPYMPVEEIADIFTQVGHPALSVTRNPHLHHVATVDFASPAAAREAHGAFQRLIARHTQPRPAAEE